MMPVCLMAKVPLLDEGRGAIRPPPLPALEQVVLNDCGVPDRRYFTASE